MKIYFRLRRHAPGVPASLYLRLYANGQRTKTDFFTGIKIDQNDWNAKKQAAINNIAVNAEIQSITQKLTEIYWELNYLDGSVLPDKWKSVYLSRVSGGHKLAALYDRYCKEHSPDNPPEGVTAATCITYITRRNLLHRYLSETSQMEVRGDHVNKEWAAKFLAWMKGPAKLRGNYPAKNITHLKQILKWARAKGLIHLNQVEGLSVKYKKPALPVYLTGEELDRLIAHRFVSTVLQVSADKFIFQCLTGVNFAELDSIDFRACIHTYQGRKFLLFERVKTGTECRVPLHPAAAALIEKYGGRFPRKTSQPYNREIKELLPLVGVAPERAVLFSNKAGRKTAAMHWLNAGFSVEVVANMLGHENTRVTQSTYARVLPDRIFAEAARLNW